MVISLNVKKKLGNGTRKTYSFIHTLGTSLHYIIEKHARAGKQKETIFRVKCGIFETLGLLRDSL